MNSHRSVSQGPSRGAAIWHERSKADWRRFTQFDRPPRQAKPHGEFVHRRVHVDQRTNVQDAYRETTIGECVVILATVLLRIHHDEVGPQLRDSSDIGILRATHVFEVGTLAESRARDRHSVPRCQRLGDRRYETDDPHDPILDERIASSQRFLSNSSRTAMRSSFAGILK